MSSDPKVHQKMVNIYQKNFAEGHGTPMAGEHAWAAQAHKNRIKYIQRADVALTHKPKIEIAGPFDFVKFATSSRNRYNRLTTLSRPGGGMHGYLKRLNTSQHARTASVYVAYDTNRPSGNKAIVGWTLILPFSFTAAASCGYAESFLLELLRKNGVDVEDYMLENPTPSYSGKMRRRTTKKRRGKRMNRYAINLGYTPLFGFTHVNVDMRYRGLGIGTMLASKAKKFCDDKALTIFVDPPDKMGQKMYEQAGATPPKAQRSLAAQLLRVAEFLTNLK